MALSTHTLPLTQAQILAALRDCYDPDLGLNIVDLGLIESISIAADPDAPGSGIAGVPLRQRVGVALILATATEDSLLPSLIQNRLAAFETISRTDIDVRSQPVWTPERIAPEARSRFAVHVTSRKAGHDLVQIKT